MERYKKGTGNSWNFRRSQLYPVYKMEMPCPRAADNTLILDIFVFVNNLQLNDIRNKHLKFEFQQIFTTTKFYGHLKPQIIIDYYKN